MNAGDLRVSASYFVANEATGGTPGYCEGGVTYMPPCEGGAIQNLTTATIEGCTFATNTARGSNGDNTACYFTYESGIGRGGAINNRSNLQVLNSTFAHNVAQGGDYYSGYGGALANSNTLILTHTTIASNSALYGSSAAVADGNGGGIYNNGGSAFLRNSLLSGNVGKNASGFTFDAGHNITSDYLDPRLLPLADYGGPTLTMALAAGSAAIDAAQISHCTPADQRGFSRPYGAGCDIGACEFLPLFSIRGTVTGYLPPGGITVLAGQQSVTTSNGGSYAIVSLMEGTYDVVASGPTVVTVPARQTVNLYADAIGVDFKSYRRNALLVESLCQDMLQITYAGAPSEMHEVQRTLGFEQWLPVLTNTTGTNGLFILSYPPGPTREFFRTRRLE